VRLNRDLILDWRLRKELTQDRAAKFLGVSPTTYRRFESGKIVQLLVAARVSNRLKIPLAGLKAKSV